ncbi:MAG: ABC transporter permease [Planctomycetota bacterium]|nr:ABC transporter permease [Planctomycetota bacterium]
MIGLGVLAAIFLACIPTLPWTLGWIGEDAAPYKKQNLDAAYLPPSWAPHGAESRDRLEALAEPNAPPPIYFLGTDLLGRDLLARCLAGGGVSIGIGMSAALISVVIGTLYGAASGYAGGRVDAAMMRIVDILYGLPYILLVVLLAVAVDAVVDQKVAAGADLSESALTFINVVTLLVAIGGVSWLTMARVIRGQVLSLKEQPFIESARAIGAPIHVLFFRHLLPNLLGPIIVYATLTVPQAILQESFLSFLGIGVQPPLPSWGNLAAEGLNELNTVKPRWWLLLFPSILLGVTLLALNFVGEGLREAFDPKRSKR